jgi:glycosyltransferase involved in cell wall biosynthesis
MDPTRCAACLRQDLQVAIGWQEERRALSRRLLAVASAIVHPSDFLRRQTLELFSEHDPGRHHVITPPFRRSHLETAVALPAHPPRHVAFAGSVQLHKGALVFEEVVRRLAPSYPTVRWSAFGGGDATTLQRLRKLPRPARVAVRGFYRPGTLPYRLRRAGVDLVLLPSIWPETYSLALEECATAGVPVLAFDLGAPADRIREQGGGLLVSLEGGAAAMAELLGEILAGRTPLPAPRAAIPSPPGGAEGTRAAADWLDLYRRLGLPL